MGCVDQLAPLTPVEPKLWTPTITEPVNALHASGKDGVDFGTILHGGGVAQPRAHPAAKAIRQFHNLTLNGGRQVTMLAVGTNGSRPRQDLDVPDNVVDKSVCCSMAMHEELVTMDPYVRHQQSQLGIWTVMITLRWTQPPSGSP